MQRSPKVSVFGSLHETTDYPIKPRKPRKPQQNSRKLHERVFDCSWADELDDLKSQRTRLLGDCLLGSSFLCYVGAFSWEFRHDMIYNMWWNDVVKRGIPVSKPFRLEALLTNDVEVSKCVRAG